MHSLQDEFLSRQGADYPTGDPDVNRQNGGDEAHTRPIERFRRKKDQSSPKAASLPVSVGSRAAMATPEKPRLAHNRLALVSSLPGCNFAVSRRNASRAIVNSLNIQQMTQHLAAILRFGQALKRTLPLMQCPPSHADTSVLLLPAQC